MSDLTLEPARLKVAIAFPNPPFEVEVDDQDSGFDVELMQQVAQDLGLAWRLVKYTGDDFNGIFDGLAAKRYDAVISGTTITPEREKVALFCKPYLEFNQSLAVNTARTPHIRSINDLHGQVVGIQHGNTSDFEVARPLLARGAIRDIKYYPYHGMLDAVNDLVSGQIGALIKLFPVLTWLTRERPELAVVQQIPTHERLAIAVAPTNPALCAAVNESQARIMVGRGFDALCRKWLGDHPAG
jgi:polar amino acid transport system substrate-binding protein